MSEDNYPAFQKFIVDGARWESIGREMKYANDHLQVFLADVRTPSRPDGVRWTVVHRKGAAVVAPMTEDGRLVLIKQERIPIRAAIWEFPAGQVDSVGEGDEAGIRATALRELQEEAGYELGATGELINMGVFFSSAGFTDEHAHLFLARGVKPSAAGAHHDEGESIQEARAFTIEEVKGMIASAEIRDANTLSTFARMYALGYLG